MSNLLRLTFICMNLFKALLRRELSDSSLVSLGIVIIRGFAPKPV